MILDSATSTSLLHFRTGGREYEVVERGRSASLSGSDQHEYLRTLNDVSVHRPTAMVLNFLYLVVGHGFYKATAFITLLLLAHYLGSFEFGRFVVALAATQLADYMSDFGMNQAVVREGAGRTQHFQEVLSAIIPVKVLLAAMSIAVSVALVFASGARPDIIEIAFYMALVQALSTLTGLLRAVFESFERMEFEALSVALDGWIRLGAVLFALVAGFGLLGIAKVQAIAALVVFSATLVVVLHRFVRPALGWSWERTAGLLVIGLPFSLVWLAVAADQRINSLLLERLAGEQQVAFFGAAVRLVEPALIVPSVLAVAFFPLAVRHDRAGLRTFGILLVSTQKGLLILSLPLLLLLWLAAPQLIAFVFGGEFSRAEVPLRLLAPAVVLLFSRIGLAQALLAIEAWRPALLVQGLGVLSNVFVALAMIPAYGESGAAVALLVGEAVAVVTSWYVLRRYLDREAILELARPLLVAVAAALFGLALAPFTLPGALAGAAAGYLLAMRLVRIFTVRDAGYLRAAFPPLALAISFAVAEER